MKNGILVSKVTERGQITLPRQIRRSRLFLGARAVAFSQRNGAVVIEPLRGNAAPRSEYAVALDRTMRDWADSAHDDLFDLS